MVWFPTIIDFENVSTRSYCFDFVTLFLSLFIAGLFFSIQQEFDITDNFVFFLILSLSYDFLLI